MPVVRRAAMPGQATAMALRLNSVSEVDSVEVVLHPLDMASVASDQLGKHVASLVDHGQAIADAPDELLT